MKYLIDVPPPTISGLLHMGHVFSYCHMDFVARAKRMNHELGFVVRRTVQVSLTERKQGEKDEIGQPGVE